MTLGWHAVKMLVGVEFNAPLDTVQVISEADLKRAVDRLSLLSAQDALLSNKASWALSRESSTAAGFFQCPQGSASLAVLALSGQSRP